MIKKIILSTALIMLINGCDNKKQEEKTNLAKIENTQTPLKIEIEENANSKEVKVVEKEKTNTKSESYYYDYNVKPTNEDAKTRTTIDANLNVRNKEAFISMGAKSLGVEKVLGYDCDVWQLGEDRIWVYNSVPLKLITKSLGLVQIQEAKLAVFNITIKEDKFKLPPFPVKAMEEIIGDNYTEEASSSSIEEENKTISNLIKQSEKSKK